MFDVIHVVMDVLNDRGYKCVGFLDKINTITNIGILDLEYKEYQATRSWIRIRTPYGYHGHITYCIWFIEQQRIWLNGYKTDNGPFIDLSDPRSIDSLRNSIVDIEKANDNPHRS